MAEGFMGINKLNIVPALKNPAANQYPGVKKS